METKKMKWKSGSDFEGVCLEHKHTGEFIEVAKLPGKKMPQLFLGSRYSCNAVATFANDKAAENFISFVRSFMVR